MQRQHTHWHAREDLNYRKSLEEAEYLARVKERERQFDDNIEMHLRYIHENEARSREDGGQDGDGGADIGAEAESL